jgi:hypothetical protein
MRDELLMLLVPLPGNIGVVMISLQRDPGLGRAAVPSGLVGLPVHDGGAGHRPTEGVRSSVDRIAEEVQQGVVDREPPGDALPPRRVALGRGERNPLLAKPQQRLSHTAEGGELLEHEGDRGLDRLVGMLLYSAVARLDVAHGQPEDQRAATGLREQALVRALPNPAEFGLAHRPLEAKQQAIIELAGIVDALRVHDERVHQAAEIEELVPARLFRARRETSRPNTAPACPG